MRRMSTQTTTTTATLKKELLRLVGAVVLLHALFIGAYYVLHIASRPQKMQLTYVAVWLVCTLLVVATFRKRIRKAQRRR